MKAILFGLLCIFLLALKDASAVDNSHKMRGWFVDESCTRDRVAEGRIEPSSTECAKRCVKDGSRLMFLSETDKALFAVKNPAPQIKNIGCYVELTGTVDEKRELQINVVQKLSAVGDSCKRPPLKDKNLTN